MPRTRPFRATFEAMHPDLPDFLREAVTIYCDEKWLRAGLAVLRFLTGCNQHVFQALPASCVI